MDYGDGLRSKQLGEFIFMIRSAFLDLFAVCDPKFGVSYQHILYIYTAFT